MKNILCFTVFVTVLYSTVYCNKIDLKQMKCLVCQRVVEEIQNEISRINPDKKIDVGGYRLDSYGEIKKTTVELRKSEIFLSDVIERICENMDDYVRATYKSNGQLALLKLVTNDGKMNPYLQDVDIVTDGDIETIKYQCESILEEYEDVAMKLFTSGADNIDIRLCTNSAHFCNKTVEDEYNFEEDKDEL